MNTSCFPISHISVTVEMLLLPNFIHSNNLFKYLAETTQLSSDYLETSADSGTNLEKKRELFDICQL